MKLPMKLRGLLRIVPMSDYEELSNIRDYLVNARLTAEEQADNNSRLCADLVEECQSQGKIIDELSDENAKLKEQVGKQADELARLEAERDSQCLEVVRLTSRLEHIFNMAGQAIGAAGDSDEMV